MQRLQLQPFLSQLFFNFLTFSSVSVSLFIFLPFYHSVSIFVLISFLTTFAKMCFCHSKCCRLCTSHVNVSSLHCRLYKKVRSSFLVKFAFGIIFVLTLSVSFSFALSSSLSPSLSISLSLSLSLSLSPSLSLSSKSPNRFLCVRR